MKEHWGAKGFRYGRDRLSRFTFPTRSTLEKWGPIFLILCTWLYTMYPLVGQTPLSHDHPTHIFKAWHQWTEMLSRFRITGWSHFWAFGFPAGELVPPGAELWVNLFYVLTGGLLSWMRVYSIAFAAALGLLAVATYVFTSRFFGRGAATVATPLAILDPGAWAQGGWYWTSDFGVWPVSLCMAFFMFAMMKWEDIVCRRKTRDMVLGGLWLAFALTTHPLALPALALTLPFFIFDCLLRVHPLPFRSILFLIPAVILGVALSGFSTFPLLARVHQTLDLGVVGRPLNVVIAAVLNLDILSNVWRPISLLAILGAVGSVRTRRFGGLFFALTASACVLLSSSWLVNGIHAERAWPSLSKIEATRMLLLAKVFWYPLAGAAVTTFWEMTREPRTPLSWPLRASRLGVLLIFLSIGAPPAIEFFEGTHFKKTFQDERSTARWEDYKSFFEWSRKERAASEDLYRIAYHTPWDDHLSTIAPVFNNTWAYKVGYTPSQNFKLFPMTFDTSVLRSLLVKYVVSDQELTPKRDFEPLRTFGALRLYRFTGYSGKPYVINGSGEATLEEFSPETIRLRVTKTSEKSRVKLSLAYHERWRAELNGQQVPVRRAPVMGPHYAVISEIPIHKDGTLVLLYAPRAVDNFGRFSSGAALPVFFLLLYLFRRKTPRLGRFFSFSAPRRRELRWWAALAAITSTLAIVLIVTGRLQTRRYLLPPTSLLRQSSTIKFAVDSLPCTMVAPLSYRCGFHVLAAALVPSRYGNHLCMTTTAPGSLTMQAKVPLKSYLDLEYAPHVDNGRVQLRVGGRTLLNAPSRPNREGVQYLRFETKSMADMPSPLLNLTLTKGPLHCFDLRTSNE